MSAEPVFYVDFVEVNDGLRLRFWTHKKSDADSYRERTGRVLVPYYTAPQTAADAISSEEGYAAYRLLSKALDVMEGFHGAITPDDECEDGIVPAASLRKFVDAHAELLYERERLAFSSICPDCAAGTPHDQPSDAPN